MKKQLLTVADGFLGLFSGHSKQPDAAFSPAKILVCRLDHVGDVVMTTPAFRALKEKYPTAAIYALTNPAGAGLLEKNKFINGVYTYNWPWPYDTHNRRFTGKHIREMVKLIRKIRQEKFDLFIDFRGDFRMLLIWGVFTRIPQRLFYNRIGGASMATVSVAHDPQSHELERVALTLEPLAPVSQMRAEIFLEDLELTATRNKIGRICQVDSDQPYVVISPFAAKSVKEWPAAKWRSVVRHITETYSVPVLVLGTRQNREQARLIAEGISLCHNLCGETSLREAAVVLSDARLVIGVDTGTLHLASCFNVPLITLFGPTHSTQYQPYSPFNELVDLNICTCNKDKHLACSRSVDGHAYCMQQIDAKMITSKVDVFFKENIPV